MVYEGVFNPGGKIDNWNTGKVYVGLFNDLAKPREYSVKVEFEKDEEYRTEVIEAIQQTVAFELKITNEVHNPFGYPRQYVKAVNEDEKRAAFFIPHENE